MRNFVEDMSEGLNLSNEINIAKRYDCPVISYSTAHPHAAGRWDHRAEVHQYVDGELRRKTIRVRESYRSPKALRDAHLQAAQEWATERLGISEWAPTGFPNSWMPKDVKARMAADLKAWRKQQADAEASA